MHVRSGFPVNVMNIDTSRCHYCRAQSKCAWSMNMSILCNCLFIEAIRRWNQLYAARNKRAYTHFVYRYTRIVASILTQRCITYIKINVYDYSWRHTLDSAAAATAEAASRMFSINKLTLRIQMMCVMFSILPINEQMNTGHSTNNKMLFIQ